MLELIELLIQDIEPTIYIGHFPDKSIDNICTLYNTPGRPPLVTFQGGSIIRLPSFQVRVRDVSYSSAINRSNEIISKLLNKSVSDNNLNIMYINLESDIIDNGRDNKNRTEITINFNYMLKTV